MKKAWFFLAVFACTLLSGPSAHAGEPALLERPVQLLIQDDLLTLWSLGLSGSSKHSQMDLSRKAVRP